MTLKKIIVWEIAYAGLLAVASIGTQRVDGYLVRKTIDGQTMLSPAPNYGNSGVLVDNNNDGILDRKYTIVASRQGLHIHDLPITDQDRQVFSYVTSKL